MIAVTSSFSNSWDKYHMKDDVGSNILKASTDLVNVLGSVGELQRFSPRQILFATEDANNGVFLVMKGRIRMSLEEAPKLDRLFTSGSLLGLPSTFAEKPYSLTAAALVTSDVIHVPQKEFLDLMRSRADLCREATDMLCKETAFIQRALAERRRHAVTVG